MGGEKKGWIIEKERMEALLRRERPDRVPVWPLGYPGFAARNAGYSIADAYNNPELALKSQLGCCEQYGWVCTPILLYGGWGSWEFGGEIRWPTGEFDQSPLVDRHPAASEEAALALELPDVRTAGFVPLETEFVERAREASERGAFRVQLPLGGPFTIAANMCGAENLCKWVIKKPDLAHRLIRLATDYSVKLFEHWKETFGTEGFFPFVGEPAASNQLISPKQFETFAMPYLIETHEKIIEMGYEHIYCHICGEANANLPFWAKVPMGDPGIVSVGHEIDLIKASEFFPNDIIMGNLEPAVLQMGQPERVYEESVALVEKGKACSGGFVFSPGCEMPPMAPPLNVWMMTKAANDAGWYEQ